MAVRLKKIKDQVLVITGATSGIGLATARLAARKGAKLVLAARNQEDLDELVDELTQQGAEAVCVQADVAHDQQVGWIARIAHEQFGGFDSWINNAGVSIYGRLTETPMDEKRRLFDVNFWGTVNGCKHAVPVLRERGGAIINIGSVLSERAIPLQGIYCASKHAVKAYTDSLRMELEAEGAPISVTLVKPAAIDTPYPEHAQSHLENEPMHTPPVYAPELVARTILRCCEKPVRDIFVGGAGKMFSFMENTMPRFLDKMMEKRMMEEGQQKKDPASRAHLDPSLFEAGHGGRIEGDYDGRVKNTSLYTSFALSPLRGLLVGALGFAAAFAGYRIARKDRGLQSAIAEAEGIVADATGAMLNANASARTEAVTEESIRRAS